MMSLMKSLRIVLIRKKVITKRRRRKKKEELIKMCGEGREPFSVPHLIFGVHLAWPARPQFKVYCFASG